MVHQEDPKRATEGAEAKTEDIRVHQNRGGAKSDGDPKRATRVVVRESHRNECTT